MVRYNRCKDNLEQRISSAERLAKEKHTARLRTPAPDQEQAVKDLRENEDFHRRLLECYETLSEQKRLLSQLDTLLVSHESAPLKQVSKGVFL